MLDLYLCAAFIDDQYMLPISPVPPSRTMRELYHCAFSLEDQHMFEVYICAASLEDQNMLEL